MWAMMAEAHRAFDSEFWHWADDAEEAWKKRFVELIDQPEMVLLVAEQADGDAVGFLVATAESSHPVFARQRAEIWDLVVLPDHRSKGLGKQLMEAAFEALTQRGAEDVVLHAARNNPAAVKLYKKLGLRPVMYRMYKRL